MSERLIRTSGLTKEYRMAGTVVHALREVSFDIRKGEFVAVMGPSGSGKSTLLNLLGFLDRPTSGDYVLDGKDVSRVDSDQRALIRNRRIGFVFQTFNLLPRSTALENVELPLVYAGVKKAERRDKALSALDMGGLGARAHHWPHQLSGGEQQRVAIARAIVNDPVLLLADEPTGALDVKTGLGILAHFQALNRAGRTIVLVTHDPGVAQHGGRIISLRDGRLISDETIAAPVDAGTRLVAGPHADPAAAQPEPGDTSA